MGQFESFIGINFWTALFVLLNTLAIFFVAKKFLFGPVHKIITDRQAEIDGMYADATKAKQEAEELAAHHQKRMAQAQSTAERLVKEAALRGQAREEEILRDAQTEANAIRMRAEAEAILERKKALNNAKDEISSMAVAIAEKVIGREISAEDQNALVDHFIDELGDDA